MIRVPPPDNSHIHFKGKTFRLFMTSRGPQKSDGRLRALDHIPPEYHHLITLVTGVEHEETLCKNYPELAEVWKTPDHVNSAAKKRTLIMSSYTEDYAILLNDDVSVHCHDAETNRWVRPTVALFKLHLSNFMKLAISDEGFGGLALHDRAFSKQALEKRVVGYDIPEAYVMRTRFIGGFFCINRVVTELPEFRLGRLNYYEDIDYSLQVLSMGFNTCQYLGMVFSHPSTKPTPWHTDRTLEVRDRDRERLISFFPHAVSKRPPDKLREDLNIDIYVKYTAAYKGADQKRKALDRSIVATDSSSSEGTKLRPKDLNVLFVCHGNINRSAAGEIILSSLKKNFNVKSCGVKDNAGGELTAKKTRTALAELGFLTEGIRSTKATKKLVEWADLVFYMDKGNLTRLTAQFPESTSKFVNLGSYIGVAKIDDPGFTSDTVVVMKVTTQILDSIKAWVKARCPIPDNKVEAPRGTLF